MIRHLPRVVPARPDRPQMAGASHPMRAVTRQIAFEPGGWTPTRKAKVAALFDELAVGWNERMTADESWGPLDDAFARGGSLAGPCVEVGAGTGIATQRLHEHVGHVLAVDVSLEMLTRFVFHDASRVLADAGSLPLPDASVSTIVAVNAFLFAEEYDRVLAPGGAIVWINSLAENTPIHLPITDVVAALPGAWNAVTAYAGWGLWAVVRRA